MSPLELAFPGLAGSGYRVTSPPDDEYNCIGWAAGESDRWWWPEPVGRNYWPAGVPRAETLDAFVVAYATVGYAPAASPDPVAGVEKVAVYARDGRPKHAARQLASGRWTSKLGAGPDIEHALADLEGEVYGTVALVLERPLPTAPPQPEAAR